MEEQKLWGPKPTCIQLSKSATDFSGSKAQSRLHIPDRKSTMERAEKGGKGVPSTVILMSVVALRQSKARNEEFQATLVAVHPTRSTHCRQFSSFSELIWFWYLQMYQKCFKHNELESPQKSRTVNVTWILYCYSHCWCISNPSLWIVMGC